ncbi:MAG: monovalent cation/H(+) antiporter subunit G [Candidatus Competibacteraceae bacterium]
MSGLLLDAGSALLLAGGMAILLIGSLGLLRMPDFYTRLHPAGMTDTLGAGLVLLGLMLQAGPTLVAIKLLLILLLLWFTSPVASHALARAALSDPENPKPEYLQDSVQKEAPLSNS